MIKFRSDQITFWGAYTKLFEKKKNIQNSARHRKNPKK